jgi:hypothetical protein
MKNILMLGFGYDYRFDSLSEPASLEWILECVDARSSAEAADLIVYTVIAPYDLNNIYSPKDVVDFLKEVREVNKEGVFWLCTAQEVQMGDSCLEGMDASAVIAPWDLKEAVTTWCRQKAEEAPSEG